MIWILIACIGHENRGPLQLYMMDQDMIWSARLDGQLRHA